MNNCTNSLHRKPSVDAERTSTRPRGVIAPKPSHRTATCLPNSFLQKCPVIVYQYCCLARLSSAGARMGCATAYRCETSRCCRAKVGSVKVFWPCTWPRQHRWHGIGAAQCRNRVRPLWCAAKMTSTTRRRLDQIVAHYSTDHAELSKDVHEISLAGQDAVMAAPDKKGIIEPTSLFTRVRQAAYDIQPRLIVIDNSADVFAGSENDRAQVRQFITLLRAIAIDANAGLLLTSHPSLTGVSTGTGLSGSTAWNASVRSRLYFKRATTEKDEEPDPDLRVLEVMKANYGPVGETIMLRWKAGLFLPIAGTGNLDKLAAQQRNEHLFLTLLNRFSGQGRNSSDKPNAPSDRLPCLPKSEKQRSRASARATWKRPCACSSKPTKSGSNHTAHRPRRPPD